MNSDRIDELLKQTAYPESVSVRQAMLQVWNELQQDFNKRTCESCEHWFMAITRDKNNNNTETPTCMLFAMSDDEYTIFPDKDFGCNKWEKKQ